MHSIVCNLEQYYPKSFPLQLPQTKLLYHMLHGHQQTMLKELIFCVFPLAQSYLPKMLDLVYTPQILEYCAILEKENSYTITTCCSEGKYNNFHEALRVHQEHYITSKNTSVWGACPLRDFSSWLDEYGEKSNCIVDVNLLDTQNLEIPEHSLLQNCQMELLSVHPLNSTVYFIYRLDAKKAHKEYSSLQTVIAQMCTYLEQNSSQIIKHEDNFSRTYPNLILNDTKE